MNSSEFESDSDSDGVSDAGDDFQHVVVAGGAISDTILSSKTLFVSRRNTIDIHCQFIIDIK